MRQVGPTATIIVVAWLTMAVPVWGDNSEIDWVARFGVGVNPAFGRIDDYPIEQLPVGWYSTWSVSSAPVVPDGIEFAQLIRVSPQSYPPDWRRIELAIQAAPGSLWIIGNEPECISQDNRTPTEYAQIFHECHQFIKERDSNAQIAIGGVVVPTPLRLKWLSQVLAEYSNMYGVEMPVEVWNIHVQILQEKRGDWGCGIPVGIPDNEGELFTILDNADPDILVRLVEGFREWMRDHGLQDKPLIISEFGVVMPSEYLGHDRESGDRVVMEFMTSAFEFLTRAQCPLSGFPEDDYRLVQRWLWYSMNEPYYDFDTQTGMNGALCDSSDPNKLTALGHHWQAYVTYLSGDGIRTYLPLFRTADWNAR